MDRVVAAFQYRDYIIIVTEQGTVFRYFIGSSFDGPVIMKLLNETKIPLK